MRTQGRKCSTCSHPELVAIQLEVAQGVPYSDLGARYGLQKSSISRHFANHVPRGNAATRSHSRGRKDGAAVKDSATSRSTGRCESCGQVTNDGEALEPQALVRRAERLLNVAEGIALRAEADNDNRLCLMSLDRAQRSLEALLKVAGLLKPEHVIVERQVNIYAEWTDSALQCLSALHDALASGTPVPEALKIAGSETNKALAS